MKLKSPVRLECVLHPPELEASAPLELFLAPVRTRAPVLSALEGAFASDSTAGAEASPRAAVARKMPVG